MFYRKIIKKIVKKWEKEENREPPGFNFLLALKAIAGKKIRIKRHYSYAFKAEGIQFALFYQFLYIEVPDFLPDNLFEI